MSSLPEIAGYYLLSLEAGEAQVEDVSHWADNEIIKIDSATPELIALSTQCYDSGEDLKTSLFKIWSSASPSASVKIFLGRIYKSLEAEEITGHQACKKVWLALADDERPYEVSEVASKLDVRVDYQRPGYFMKEESAYRHYLSILRPFEEWK
jgi:hypothetical protein